MKKIIIVITLLISYSVFSQEFINGSNSIKFYNSILFYTPKTLNYKTVHKINDIEFEPKNFNNLHRLRLLSWIVRTEKDKNWVKNRIDEMATALFLDGKKILLTQKNTGGNRITNYYDFIKLNNHSILNLNLFHDCTDGHLDEFFVNTFNKKMLELLQIKEPDAFTHLFIGLYKNKSLSRLTITEDRKYTLSIEKCIFSGIWENDKNVLQLYDENKRMKLYSFELTKNKKKLISSNGKLKLKRFSTSN
ncbi:hypothetical protein [Tenacibaculum xiamenense]|uniref:hypothetical protein n=1 Tax=Tenacibaculum xiamenense TaxID=1261553 RepID=UPI003894348B